MASRTDGPAPLLRPLPLTQTQLSYYVKALGLPPQANIVCEQFGPLGHMDSRLADCVWNIFGLDVDPTPTPPDYPFLRLTMESGPEVQVQVWLWQMCILEAPMWAELRWHPTDGTCVNFVNLSADASTRTRQVATLDRAVKGTMLASQRGRPVHSGFSREELLAKVTEIVRAYWQQHGLPPTQEAVLQLLYDSRNRRRELSDRGLRRVVKEQTGLIWELFVERYRPR